MADGLVKLDWQGTIAVISLNRPDRHNALVPELLTQLLSILEDENCRAAPVLVLRAEGQSFSTGGDLLGFQQHRNTIGEYAFTLVSLLNQVIIALYSHPATIVCAVQGQVTGGSLGLLLASDWVIMQRDATITPWYATVSFSPDGGWVAMLPDVIGREQTIRWLSNNECHNADSCLELGLVHQVEDGDCAATAMLWADKIAVNKPGGVKRGRQPVNITLEELRLRLAAERDAFVTQIKTQKALDGIDQFLRRQ